jgi:hypothetical protein
MALRCSRFSSLLLGLVTGLASLALVSAPGAIAAQDGPAAAAPSAEAQAEARRLFDEGRAHADAERWPAAVTSFESSRALLERPSTVFNLASALVRVGRSLDALEALAVLERIADPRRDRVMLAGVPALRERAESSILHVVLTVSPDTAALEVDGEPIEGVGPRRELTLDPGAHSASLSLAGFTTERVEIAQGSTEVAITLRPRLARVHIEPSLTSAAVTVDGTARGMGEVDVELEAGPHVLEVTATGHEPLTRQIDVEPGAELTVAADLVPIARPVATGTDLPLIVGLSIGGFLVLAGVATALGVVLGVTTEAPSGGTTNTVIAVPLTGPTAVRF